MNPLSPGTHRHLDDTMKTSENGARRGAAVWGIGLSFCLGAAMIVAAAGAGAAQEDDSPFAAPAPIEPGEVMMLKLRTGDLHFGAIEEHTPESIEFVRLDTGGRATVPWSMLEPTQSEELRTKFGYVQTEVEEALVEGERLVLDGGGSVEGVIVSREGQNFVIKTDGNLQVLPKIRVRSIETGIQIPALDVYSREEMYSLYAADADETSAESQLDLARKCESILDFTHAVDHYEAALELGLADDREAERAGGALAAARVKSANQEQLDVLRGADQLRKRGRYDEALAITRAFPGTYEDSPLVEDARKAELRILSDRDKAASDMTRRRWIYWAKRLTRERAREGSFEETRTWAIEAASEEIQARVHTELVAKISQEIGLEDVRGLWEARRKRSYEAATYGSAGTWLLGEDRANRGAEEEQTQRPGPVSAIDAERQALEERIRRYVDNQRVAARGRSNAEAEDERESFWRSWSASGRAQWVFSYYVEESGDFELRARPYLRPCKTCAGRGAIELLVTGTVLRGENASLARCPLCQGVRVVRRIYFR